MTFSECPSHDGGASGYHLYPDLAIFEVVDPTTGEVVPDGEDAFEGTRETLAHELTHHWLHVRCPRLSEEQVESQSALTPGFWVVEGFASLVDDFQFRATDGALHVLVTLTPFNGEWLDGKPTRAMRMCERTDQRLDAGEKHLPLVGKKAVVELVLI